MGSQHENLPPRQMVAALANGNEGLVDDVSDEKWTGKQRQGVEQLVHLKRAHSAPGDLRKVICGRKSAHHGVSDVRVRRPDVTLHEQRTEIRPPSVTCPAKYLLQEPPVGLHRTEKLRLLAALHVGAPAVADHPPGEVLVVARVELVLPEPVVVGESVQELGVLENDRPVGRRTTRETGETAVDVSRGRNLDVPDGETERGENLPDGHVLADRLHALGCADTTDLLVLKAGEDVRKHGRGPDGVVVSEDDNVGGAVFDAVRHLEPLVGEGDGQDTNALWVDGVGEVLEGPEHLLLGDDENLLGLADEPTVGGLLELLSGVDGGDDDRDILLSDVGRVLG